MRHFKDAIRTIELSAETGQPALTAKRKTASLVPEPIETDEDGDAPRKRTFRGLAGRMTLAVIVIGIGVAALTDASVQEFLLSFTASNSAPAEAEDSVGAMPARAAPEVVTANQRALLYEEDQGDPQGKSFSGRASWRTMVEQPGPSGRPELIVRLDVAIPERGLLLSMTMRDTKDSGAMSHLLELRFTQPDRSLFEGVVNLGKIFMTNEEHSRRLELVGRMANVRPGLFLLGLSGLAMDVQENARHLREQSWLDFALVYQDGSRALLTVEKGDSGQQAIEEAFSEWGQ
jgi:hypothetical protein